MKEINIGKAVSYNGYFSIEKEKDGKIKVQIKNNDDTLYLELTHDELSQISNVILDTLNESKNKKKKIK